MGIFPQATWAWRWMQSWADRSVFTLIDCIWRRQLLKPGLIAACACYLLIVLGILLPAAQHSPFEESVRLFHGLQVVHFLLALIVPGVLGSNLLQDLQAGALELAKVAGITPDEWLGFRLATIAGPYCVLWVLRLPFYAYVLRTGGCTWLELLWAEAFHWTMAMTCAQTSLAVARKSKLVSAAIWNSICLLGYGNAAFLWFATLIPMMGRLAGGSLDEILLPIGSGLKSLSMLPYLFDSPAKLPSAAGPIASLTLHWLFGLMTTRRLRRQLLEVIDPESLETGLAQIPGIPTKGVSRRVWDDAFAWQSAVFYFATPTRRAQIYTSAVVALVLVSAVNWKWLPTPMIGMWMVMTACSPWVLASTCAQMEIRQKTMPALAILPLGGLGIYHGWQSGTASRRLGAFLKAGCCLAVMLWRSPLEAPMFAIAAVAGIYVIPPLAFFGALSNTRVIPAVITIAAAVTVIFVSLLAGLGWGIGLAVIGGLLSRPLIVRRIDREFERASST